MDPNMIFDDEVIHDFLPYFRVCKDGSVQRYILMAKIPPGLDQITGTRSKDVIFSDEPKLGARIFLPKMDIEEPNKVPLLVHYHGGGFCTGSAYGPIMKQSLTQIISFTHVAIISIDYRLAPESPLPIAYDDAWAGLKWVATHSHGNGSDPWLNEYINFEKIYIIGEGEGANIANYVAVRAGIDSLESVQIIGMCLIHPYFSSSDPNLMVEYLYPNSGKLEDNPILNPTKDPNLRKLVCKRVLVCVAEKDEYRNRGIGYYNQLVKSGWDGIVEFLETEDEGHCFHLFLPNSDKTGYLLFKLASFVSDDDD